MPLGPNTVVDAFGSFPQGMNAGIDPAELPKGQLANLVNGTVRGDFVSSRPPFQLLGVSGDTSWTSLLYQGACYYKPDSGPEQIVAQIGGNVYAFTPGYGTVAVSLLKSSWNPPQLTQAWLWQAEKWVIGNDGQSLPWWYDGTQVVRSGGTGQIAIIPGALSSLVVGMAQTVAIDAWTATGGDLGAGSYTGPFSVPVDIVDTNGTGLSIGQFEIQQNSNSTNGTLAGVAPGAGTGATNGEGQTLPAGTNLSIPVPNTTWAAHTTAQVTAAAGTKTTTTDYSTTVSEASTAGSGLVGYLSVASTANLSAGQAITVGGKSLTVSSVNAGNVLAIAPVSGGWSFGQRTSVTWSITVTVDTPQPTSITIPISSAFPGGNTLFLMSTSSPSTWVVTGQYSVISSGVVNGVNTVTLAISSATTINNNVTVTNNPTPGSYWSTVATLAAQAVVPSSGSVTISTVAVYTGGSQKVYATIDGALYSFTLVGTAPTTVTSISLYVVSLNTGVTGAAAGAAVILANQLPVGKMGAYIRDRNYIALPDGLSFTVSDAAGESSGSVGNQFRDAVLFCNDINQLTTGNFRVPGGSGGSIQFFTPANQLDASLGQGPGQVGTPQGVFSVNLPDDSTQWQTTTNPLLPQSIIGGGASGAWSVVNVNNDILYRASDGSIRSLNLARQDFNTWGQVPCSREVSPILAADSPTLLPWCSAVAFDNRAFWTTGLVQGPLGVYGTQTVAINFDRVSSLAGKSASVWDGVWNGLNVLQFVTGSFGGVLRCFAFQFNTITQLIELWEVLPSPPKPQTGPLSPYAISDYETTGYVSTASLYGGKSTQAITPGTNGAMLAVGGTNATPAIVANPGGVVVPKANQSSAAISGVVGQTVASGTDVQAVSAPAGTTPLINGIAITLAAGASTTGFLFSAVSYTPVIGDVITNTTTATSLTISGIIVSGSENGIYQYDLTLHNTGGSSVSWGAGDLCKDGSGALTVTTEDSLATAATIVGPQNPYIFSNTTTLLLSSAWPTAVGNCVVKITGNTGAAYYILSAYNNAGVPVPTSVTLLTPTEFFPNVGDVLSNVTASGQPVLTVSAITLYPSNNGDYWSVTVNATNSSTASNVTLNQGDLVQDVAAGGSGSLTYGNGGSPAPAISSAVTLAPFQQANGVFLSNPWTVGNSIVTINGQAYLLFNPLSVGQITNLVPIKTRLETGRMLGVAAPAGEGGTARSQAPNSKRPDQICMLTAGELYFKDLQDDITITVYWRPDYSWNWQTWRSWTVPFQPNQASFCRAVGLGEPPNNADPSTNRPWRQFYHCYLAIEITGHATLMGGRVYAELQPTQAFAPMNPVT